MGNRVVNHNCKRLDLCICSQLSNEPNENCPIHGNGEWPPRCMICGKFMKFPTIEMIYSKVGNNEYMDYINFVNKELTKHFLMKVI
jgi:hypothetical protein